jgi:hypothetical protein
MRPAPRCMLTCLALSAWLSAVSFAPAGVSAQDEEEEEAAEGEAAWAVPDEADAAKEEAAAEPAAKPASGAPKWWFGAYLQGAFVPSFMLKLFLDDAPTVSNVGFGITATHRNENGMSFVIGIGYAPYGFVGPFRIAGDPVTDTEILDSSLALLHLRGQMLWSSEIVDNMLSFEYGFGIDVGLVLGELRRTEARPDGAGGFQACSGPGFAAQGVPDLSGYCDGPAVDYDAYGAHYNVVEKRVPPVALIPMLPALALRYTPIPNLAVKLDAAFGLMQFAIGLSAAYGVNL